MVLRRWEIETEIYFIKRVDKGLITSDLTINKILASKETVVLRRWEIETEIYFIIYVPRFTLQKGSR